MSRQNLYIAAAIAVAVAMWMHERPKSIYCGCNCGYTKFGG